MVLFVFIGLGVYGGGGGIFGVMILVNGIRFVLL